MVTVTGEVNGTLQGVINQFRVASQKPGARCTLITFDPPNLQEYIDRGDPFALNISDQDDERAGRVFNMKLHVVPKVGPAWTPAGTLVDVDVLGQINTCVVTAKMINQGRIHIHSLED